MKTNKSVFYFLFLFCTIGSALAQSSFNKHIIGSELLIVPKVDFAISELYIPTVQVELISRTMNIYLLRCSNDLTAKNLLEKYRTDTRIIMIQYNHRFDYRSYSPVDSYYSNQWYLNNTGQYGYTVGIDIDAPQAWDSTTRNITKYGDTIVVAVPDVKFDLFHRDINYFKNYDEIPSNGIDDDANGYIDDYQGWNALLHNDDVHLNTGAHATQLAGIIGAKHDLKGVTGVCNGVKILPIYTQAIESQAIEAYTYIVDMRKLYDATAGLKGAYIVASNSSFGIDNELASDFPIWCAMYDSMGKYGILSATATANRNQDVDVVGDMPTTCLSHFMLTTTNTTGLNQINISAAYGSTSIDMGAPGTNIFSCIGPDGYAGGNGTSFASPQIAGTVALLMSYACEKFLDLYAAHPDSAILLLKKYIMDGTLAVPDLAGKTVTGGKLNLKNALNEMYNQFDCTNCNGSISATITNIKCNGDSSGQIQIDVIPSNANLTYSWSNGANSRQIVNLRAGTYNVTITDSVGCERLKTFMITESNELLVDSISVTPIYTGTNGSIYVRGIGGTGPYTYSIDGTNYFNSTLFVGLTAGPYTVYIKDANDCIITQNIIVENHTGIENSLLSNTVEVLNNAASDEIQFRIKNNSAVSIQLLIANMQGQIIIPAFNAFKDSSPTLQKIDISSLSNGLYLLSFYSDNALIKTFKIVKY